MTIAGMPPRLLIADDDRAIRGSLRRALELNGYSVSTVPDGVQALAETRRACNDVLVLDLMLPGLNGLDVCRVLRGEGDRTPILMLTARGEIGDRVTGLDAGADDYLPKPFELEELLARLRALLRRLPSDADNDRHGDDVAAAEDRWVRAGLLRLDPPARRAWYADAELELSKTEFDLLDLLARNEGIVLDHATIYTRIWGYDFGPDSKNLAVYVSYLRRKLSAVGAPRLIRTVRGVGYTVRAE